MRVNASLVARRGRLPGLRTELRRRQRRRNRRHRGRARASSLPGCARRRRAVVQPLVPVAAGRRRLRHLGLPVDRSRLRHALGGRAADHRGARARDPHDRRHRPQPHLQRAPVVPRGAGLARRARRHAGSSGSGPAAASTASCRPTPGSRSSVARPGRASRTASGTCTCSRPSSPTSTGSAPRSGPSTRTSCASGSSAASPACGSTLRRCWSRTRALADEPAGRRPRRASVHRPRRAARDLPPLARDRRQLRRSRACWSVRSGCRTPSASRATCAPTSSTPPSTSTSSRVHGSRVRCGARSSSALAAHAPVDAPATWVLSNHDVTRPVTRYGRAETGFSFETKREGTPTDLARGRAPRSCSRAAGDGAARVDVHLPGRGARPAGGGEHPAGAAPGSDVAPLRTASIPVATAAVCRSRGRVPSTPYGFSPNAEAQLWLDQPDGWAPLSVEAEIDDPDSMLSLYRTGLTHPPPGAVGRRAPDCAGSTTAMT